MTKTHSILELLYNELALFKTKDIYHITWCYIAWLKHSCVTFTNCLLSSVFTNKECLIQISMGTVVINGDVDNKTKTE